MPDPKHWFQTLFLDSPSENNSPPFIRNDAYKHYRVLNNLLIIMSSCILAYTMFSVIQKERTGLVALMYGLKQSVVVYMTLAIACITGIALLRTRLPFFIPVFIPVILLTLNCVEFLRIGLGDGFSGLWIFVIPPLTYFTAGKKTGFVVSLALFTICIIFLVFPRLSVYYYSTEKVYRIITVYILLFITTHVYEHIRTSKEKNLEKLNRLLKAERDEFIAMRNSLKIGLFLMDKDLIIQKHYSHLLNDILGEAHLSGRKFTDLLTLSLTSAEISSLGNFFDMVRERRFDAGMLEDINPLQEFKYVCGEGGQIKTLQCVFTPIDRASGDTVIMGSIEDITSKVEFEKQLQKEEAKHQEEMNTLFEVLQIDPAVFNDFIEDTEYEFETINDVLKNSKISSKDTLVTISQSIHAIKSNAAILGLNNYSQKLHDLESYIKDLQVKSDVVFDDMLNLTFRIEEVMTAKDKFSESIEKVKTFVTGRIKKSAVDILVESLRRTVERMSASTGKKVVMDTSGVAAAAFEKAPRRIVKEALLQLVRNAMFHGIEIPEERVKKGKKETGRIKLSLKQENENIHIMLQDDGRGLDFEKIKQRVEKMHLIKKNESIGNKNLIYQAIFMPGFSTAENANMYAGRGMGLDLVRSRIREHNGTIKIQTEAGKGSVFHIFLPLQNTEEDIKE